MIIAGIVFLLIVSIVIIKVSGTNNNNNVKFNNLNELQALIKCQVPALTMSKCLSTEYYKCPRFNGSYKQCTNNNIPNPDENNCPCKNRTFEMCPFPFRISEKCYNNIHKKDANKDTNSLPINKNNPRINKWKGDITNNNFLIQCA